MSFTAVFFTFKKIYNSTAQPNAADGVQVPIELKDPASILNPDIVLTGIPNPYVWNYVHIATFNRYYWVTNWTWEAGRWIGSLKVDVLASHKHAIGESEQYVLRSAARSNTNIRDTIYPMTNEFRSASTTITVSRQMTMYYQQGYFIIGIISKGATNLGSVTYYALTSPQFAIFRNALFNDISWASVSDVSSDLLKTLVNPFDYVVSCKWSPCTDIPLIFDTEVTTIPVGYWSFTCSARVLSNNALTLIQHRFQIGAEKFTYHPQVTDVGSFLNYAPYTECRMLIAPYGVVPLPSEAIMAGVTCIENIDVITGEAILNIFAYGSDFAPAINPLAVVYTDMFVDIQIAQVRNGNSVTDIAKNAGLSMTQKALSSFGEGPIQNMLSGVVNAVHESTSIVRTSGNNGGLSRFAQYGGFNINLTQQFNLISSPDPTHLGYPLCENAVIGDLSGYILCGHAEIATIGTDPEQNEIKNLMESGFYYI